MDRARYKLPILQGLYVLSIALPLAAACFVLAISYETLFRGAGLGVYGYLTMLLVCRCPVSYYGYSRGS